MAQISNHQHIYIYNYYVSVHTHSYSLLHVWFCAYQNCSLACCPNFQSNFQISDSNFQFQFPIPISKFPITSICNYISVHAHSYSLLWFCAHQNCSLTTYIRLPLGTVAVSREGHEVEETRDHEVEPARHLPHSQALEPGGPRGEGAEEGGGSVEHRVEPGETERKERRGIKNLYGMGRKVTECLA